ncbi:hypothetical protein ACJRO7_035310 [Eucalyptus globulus]|uniref:Uncharacterized protein n=1 Tax=Eucalyptus globulus TaxID=34317 RepID=A0ABD3J8I8_EUCGL
METSLESNDGIVAHGQLEFKSLFHYGLVDQRPYHDSVTEDRQVEGGVSSDHQWGPERDDHRDDRRKREVVMGLSQQQPKQMTRKNKKEKEKTHGTKKWSQIAQMMKGRRKQFTKHKLLPHGNNSNLLQNYIRSVRTPSPPKQSTAAHGREHCHHKTEKYNQLPLASVRSPPHHQPPSPPPLAQRLASNYFGFPMVDGNGDLGLYQVKDHHYHRVLSEGGGNGIKKRYDNGHKFDFEMTLEMDGVCHRHRRHQHQNDHHRQKIKELDLLEKIARRSG